MVPEGDASPREERLFSQSFRHGGSVSFLRVTKFRQAVKQEDGPTVSALPTRRRVREIAADSIWCEDAAGTRAGTRPCPGHTLRPPRVICESFLWFASQICSIWRKQVSAIYLFPRCQDDCTGTMFFSRIIGKSKNLDHLLKKQIRVPFHN